MIAAAVTLPMFVPAIAALPAVAAGAVTGAITGGAGALLQGGDLKDVLKGAAFGSVGTLNGWATRSIALGAIGAASAKMHGGGTTEIISGAITLAGLGFAGPMIGLKRPGEGAFTAPPKQTLTLTPAYSVLRHDSGRLTAHAEPLNNFMKGNGKGY